MKETLSGMWSLLRYMNFANVIDILIVSYLLYKVFMLVRETRAETLLKGIIIIFAIKWISQISGLILLNSIIEETLNIGLITLIIIFQPELRRALEHLGRSRLFAKPFIISDEEMDNFISQIVDATVDLSKTKTGALIVLEQDTGLNDYIVTGTKLDAIVSSGLLENIFVVNTPLHDGAVIIRNDRIVSAGCFLPLTDNRSISKELGTRHRAALGVSENSDAVVIVVSEETGIISLAINGRITRNYNAERLKDILMRIMRHRMSKKTTAREKVKSWIKPKSRT